MGVCDSEGRVHDFAGPYYIGIDNFMTGRVYKYYQFDANEFVDDDAVAKWDNGIESADRV